jgi:hypothetical protein
VGQERRLELKNRFLTKSEIKQLKSIKDRLQKINDKRSERKQLTASDDGWYDIQNAIMEIQNILGKVGELK